MMENSGMCQKRLLFMKKVTREKAWETRLHGFLGRTVKVDSDYVSCPVKPFRFVAPNKLPKNYAMRLK